MKAKKFVEKLDWSSAIAAATLVIENKNKKKKKKGSAYLYRGIAYCFISSKEGKHKEAIDDLSRAITLKKNNDKAYCYRAYAYYQDGDYERAIADCRQINNSLPKNELLGNIYFLMNNYHKAVKKFGKKIKKNKKGKSPPIFTPVLLDSYREACKKMNRV
jgi:tetratricopeptide (TPR) repeat protein